MGPQESLFGGDHAFFQRGQGLVELTLRCL